MAWLLVLGAAGRIMKKKATWQKKRVELLNYHLNGLVSLRLFPLKISSLIEIESRSWHVFVIDLQNGGGVCKKY